MPEYPGLGLPLRHGRHLVSGDILEDESFYPIGAHHSCARSDSLPIPVRELAMMNIMNEITDKENWHREVFDEEIIAKWREEARRIPDKHFLDLVECHVGEHVDASANPAKILNDESFEYVSYIWVGFRMLSNLLLVH